MKTNLFFPLLYLLLVAMSGQAQITITNADLEAGLSYSWTSDNEYFLDGVVFVKPGSILTIEAGTVIKGLEIPSNGDANSMLIVSAGAQIFALGEPSCPIIFTSEYDDVNLPDDLTEEDRGLWGGVAILGTGILGDASPSMELFGLSADIDNYGGNDNTDNSGIMRYVSIRYTGSAIAPGNEPNALTLAAVGSETIIEHVEAYAGFDDGFEFLGGAVNAKYLISAYCGDDAFDIDVGYVGKGQFWFGITSGEQSLGIECDGAKPDDNPIYSSPTLSNITLVGNSSLAPENRGILLRDGTAGALYNSVMSSYSGKAFIIETNENPVNSYDRLVNGEIEISNNVWFDVASGNSLDSLVEVWQGSIAERDVVINHLTSNSNTVADPQFTNICYGGVGCLDPRPQAGSPALSGALDLNDSFFDDVDYRGAFGSTNWMVSWSALYDTPLSNDCGTLQQGTITVQWDEDGDCQPDTGEPGLSEWIIEIITPGFNYFVSTDENGVYEGYIPTGATSAVVTPPNYLWSVCQTTLPLENLGDPGIVNAAFTATAIQNCPLMTVDLSAIFLRRCFENNYFIDYCNEGTVLAEEAYIELELDDDLIFNSATIPYTVNADGLYVFELGDVDANACSRFSVNFTVSCEAELGQSHCSTAEIFPDTSCIPTLNAPKLEISSECVGEEVQFTITNVGNTGMDEGVPYIVIEDHVMMNDPGGEVELDAGESMLVTVPGNGSTYHIQIMSYPTLPELGPFTAGIEGCGENMQGGFSTGFLTGFALGDNQANVSTDCQVNIGSFDPNDKLGYPAGIQEEHYLRANTDIDFRIRFQNTGTDTAFTVVVIDTLSEYLDLNTLRVGASSHDYEWALEDRALIFRFDNIMLPDSNINEPASNGFVKFKISQLPNLEDGIEITNLADIYFDFNEPIRTNEVFYTIGQPFQVDVLNSLVELQAGTENVKVVPNPFSEMTTFQLEQIDRGWLDIYDAQGRLIIHRAYTGDTIELVRGDLNAGIYFFNIHGEQKTIGSGKILIK